MASNSLAMMVRPPRIDLPGSLGAASRLRQNEAQIEGTRAQARLSDYRLSRSQDRENSLGAYRNAQQQGDPNAMQELAGHPELFAQVLKNREGMQDAQRADYDRKLLKGARDAQRLRAMPEGPERAAALQALLKKDFDAGLITKAEHDSALKFGATDANLRNLAMMGLSLEKQFELERGPKPTSLMQNLASAGIKPGTPQYRDAILSSTNRGTNVTINNDRQQLTRGARTTTQKDLASQEAQIVELDSLVKDFDPSFLTYKGKAKAAAARFADKAEDLPFVGPAIDAVAGDDAFLGRFTAFTQGVEQSFNAYRKDITGAAAAIQELEKLKRATINVDQSPAEFQASAKRYREALQRGIMIKRALLKKGIDVGDQRFGPEFDRAFLGGEGRQTGNGQPDAARVFNSQNIPPENERRAGDVVNTDKGTFQWDGSGWEAVE